MYIYLNLIRLCTFMDVYCWNIIGWAGFVNNSVHQCRRHNNFALFCLAQSLVLFSKSLSSVSVFVSVWSQSQRPLSFSRYQSESQAQFQCQSPVSMKSEYSIPEYQSSNKQSAVNYMRSELRCDRNPHTHPQHFNVHAIKIHTLRKTEGTDGKYPIKSLWEISPSSASAFKFKFMRWTICSGRSQPQTVT